MVMKFSLVIPLWNEERNIVDLVESIFGSRLPDTGMAELILVNNGSTDQTGVLVTEMAEKYPWIIPVQLEENLNYGGGVYEGFQYTTSDIVCYIPGDLQVMPDDVIKVYQQFCEYAAQQSSLFVKGFRVIRHDPLQTQIVSWIYTFLANRVLNLRVKDVNGLPKMFHRNLLDLLPSERMKTFVFDSQILSIARENDWTVLEVPVTFHGRREGVSSWSKKRIQVYIQVFSQLMRLRSLKSRPAVPLE